MTGGMTGGDKIVQAAMRWLGTPHVNGACVRGRGVDCGHLLAGVVIDAGLISRSDVHLPDNYPHDWHLHRSDPWFLNYIQAYCDEVTDMRPGDFLVWQYGRCVSHAGIYMGHDTVCHAYVDMGTVLSNIHDVMFCDAVGHSRLRGIYRFRGLRS
nr:MAG TPA: cell wall-associated hydrolase [Bacteriophage sp.]